MKYIISITLLFCSVLCKAQTKDLFPEREIFGKFCAKFALDEKPIVPADTNLIAIWTMKEDVDIHNYFVLERFSPNEYVYTYMNRGGSNRTYENMSAFFSKIGGADFINVVFHDHETDNIGYFFLKVTDLDKRGWNMTLWLVADSTLNNITSREALRERISKNVNNPDYYKKPVHFHKKLPLMFCK